MAIKGMAQLRRNVRKQLTLAIPSHAERAMHIATSIIGGYATLMTPVDTSNLINSQYRIVKNEGRRVVAAIGYTARYAAAVHEKPGTLRGAGVARPSGRGNYWDPSGEPQFLSKAGDENMDEIDAAITKAMTI